MVLWPMGRFLLACSVSRLYPAGRHFGCFGENLARFRFGFLSSVSRGHTWRLITMAFLALFGFPRSFLEFNRPFSSQSLGFGYLLRSHKT